MPTHIPASRPVTSDDLLAEMRTLHPKLIDLSLGRIATLLARLGHPERHLPPVVHIAGTNGKGSTTAYLTAMLQAAGKRVHAYTSPHLVRFAERIAVPGADGRAAPIGEDALVRLLGRVRDVNAGAPITFFEVTTAAAFLAFAEIAADAVLLEVGLGGRFDATNVVTPALGVITPISMDHADKLGATVELIAREKAGILKRGVTTVVSQQTESVMAVIEAEAARVGARLVRWGQEFEAFEQRGRLVFQAESRLLDLPRPALIGRHQIVNAGAAIAAALELASLDPRSLDPNSLDLGEPAIGRGLVDVRWLARMQALTGGLLARRLPAGSELWLDGGHNAAGGQAIAQTMADLEERAPKPLCVVVGMKGHKDAEAFLRPFRGLARRIIAVPVPDQLESMYDPADVARVALGLGFTVETATGVAAALDRLRVSESAPVRALICGSLYLAGHVLALETGVAQQSN